MFTVHVSRRDQNADKIWPLQFRKNPLSPLHVQYFVLALNCVVCLAKVIPFINNFKLSIWKEITVRWEAFANIYPLENNSLAVVEHNLIWKVSLLPEWFNQSTEFLVLWSTTTSFWDPYSLEQSPFPIFYFQCRAVMGISYCWTLPLLFVGGCIL